MNRLCGEYIGVRCFVRSASDAGLGKGGRKIVNYEL